MWTVKLERASDRVLVIYTRDWFPRYYRYKKDAERVASNVARLGGVARVLPGKVLNA